MGGRGSRHPVPTPDETQKKYIKLLKLSDRDLAKMWDNFSKYDGNTGNGVILVVDFIHKMLEEPKTLFTEAVFEFVGVKKQSAAGAKQSESSEIITFSEYLELVCIFCVLDESDLLKFVFYVFDPKKTGRCEKQEIKDYIFSIHNRDIPANLEMGLQALHKFNDDIEEKHVYFIDFYDIMTLHRRFPLLFYPMFRFQTALQATSISINWWQRKKSSVLALKNGTLFDGLKAVSKDRKISPEEEAERKLFQEKQELELATRERMGVIKYYCMPWEREEARFQVKRINELEKELDEKERLENGGEEEEDQHIEENVAKLAKFAKII